jgi:hypothetical protein
MRRLLSWAIWLYPASWRARYAREFGALLDDLNPRWRDLWDMFRGAILMQLSTPAVYLKLGAITAVIGALIACGVSFTLPERYVSSAVLRITPKAAAPQRLLMMQQEILSRISLAQVIQQPSLDLYTDERQRLPLEDIILNMRRNDVRIQPVDDSSFRISFEYADRQKAQAVVRALVTKFAEANVTTSQNVIRQAGKARASHDVPAPNSAASHFLLPSEPDSPPPTPSKQPAPSPEQVRKALATNLEVLDPASLPDRPLSRNRLGMVAVGLGAGFALGLLIAFLRGRPLRWTLWMTASGIAGLAAALAVAFPAGLDPAPFALLGCATGLSLAAFLMRDRAAWKPAPYLKSALATGVLAAILAGFASYAIPERYVSTAVLRAVQQDAYGLPGPDTTGAASERLHQIQQEILSRSSLAEMIQRPALDLYRKQRQRDPLEVIIHGMLRDIRIHPADGSVAAFTISFEYTDRFKAQAVVRELTTKFTEKMEIAERSLGRDRYTPGAIHLEILDPASGSETPVSPNRFSITAIGCAAGIAIGLLIAFFRRRPPGEAWAMVRFAAAGGAAGAVIAAALSFAIPDRYVSTAVLRVT